MKLKYLFERKDYIEGGIADKFDREDFDVEQLKIGTEIELEHTDSKAKAEEIAMDHLAEDPNYYKKLKKIHKDK